jgi:hypothetical protein
MVESISADSQTSQFFSDVWRFDTTTSTWEEITTLGERAIARNAHSASVVAGKMYVFGGSNDDGPMSAISALDLSTTFSIYIEGQSKIYMHYYSSAVFPGSFVWERIQPESAGAPAAATAGSPAAADAPAAPIPVMAPSAAAAAATKVDTHDETQCPEGREMHSAVVMGPSIFIFGGRTSESVADHFYEFQTGAISHLFLLQSADLYQYNIIRSFS